SVPEAAPTREPVPPHPVVARYVASGGPDFRIGSGGAFYRPADDSVHVPAPGAFESPDAYHSTVFHELVHSTGHKKRLGRFESPEQFEFASASYSREELVAELGAAFLCGECGISRTLENSASYLDAWLRVLRQPKNSRLIVEAAGKAQKAADFVLARDAYTEGGES
ncbi:MAG: antirestriction protein ArdC, partial [Planctomycetes bacterium]|nr:antirestriction protein ArdC [Planctomycetota bacterium]